MFRMPYGQVASPGSSHARSQAGGVAIGVLILLVLVGVVAWAAVHNRQVAAAKKATEDDRKQQVAAFFRERGARVDWPDDGYTMTTAALSDRVQQMGIVGIEAMIEDVLPDGEVRLSLLEPMWFLTARLTAEGDVLTQAKQFAVGDGVLVVVRARGVGIEQDGESCLLGACVAIRPEP
jgi:hypothetical protein